jgi:hypothetical protein
MYNSIFSVPGPETGIAPQKYMIPNGGILVSNLNRERTMPIAVVTFLRVKRDLILSAVEASSDR